ncbi:hypothetical protein VTL71DRAFT_8127 [Oculimacula yallundae]|uniref:BTB domain-containing protein n=1 Tax=Oculimacula yallundae TaxID=86028 RepID=A0ABR4CWN6_9HELO
MSFLPNRVKWSKQSSLHCSTSQSSFNRVRAFPLESVRLQFSQSLSPILSLESLKKLSTRPCHPLQIDLSDLTTEQKDNPSLDLTFLNDSYSRPAKNNELTMPSKKNTAGAPSTSAEKKKAPNFTSALTMVKLMVQKGDDKKEFHIHREIASYHSPAFNDILKSGKKSVTLFATPPALFGNIQCWMYTGELCGPDDKTLLPAQLCILWRHALNLKMPKLQNHIMRKLFNNKSMDIIAVSRIYEMTSDDPKSKLRQLYLDRCTFEWPRKEWYPVASALCLEYEDGNVGAKLSGTFFIELIDDVFKALEEDAEQLRHAIVNGNAFDKKEPKKLKLEDYFVEEVSARVIKV